MTLTLLYTHNLHGEIHALPRLATLMRRARAEFGRVACVDLGGACHPSVWHCEVTGGRSMLAALDGCGYVAAHADGLTPQGRAGLDKAIFSMHMVDDDHPARVGTTSYRSIPVADPEAALTVLLRPAESTRLDGTLLSLAAIPRLHLGVVTVDIAAGVILKTDALTLTPDTRPDATLSGVVDFILGEARLFQKRQQRG